MGYHYALTCKNVAPTGSTDNQCADGALTTCGQGETKNSLGTACSCTASPDSCASNTTAPKHCGYYPECGGNYATCDTVGGANQCVAGLSCVATSSGNLCYQTCSSSGTTAACADPFSYCQTVSGVTPTVCEWELSAGCTTFQSCTLGSSTQGYCRPFENAGALVGQCLEPGVAPVGGHCNPYAQRPDGPGARCAAGAICLFVPNASPATAYGGRCLQFCDLSGSGGPTCSGSTTCHDLCPGSGCTTGLFGYCS
jgi:hypothetical protein